MATKQMATELVPVPSMHLPVAALRRMPRLPRLAAAKRNASAVKVARPATAPVKTASVAIAARRLVAAKRNASAVRVARPATAPAKTASVAIAAKAKNRLFV